MLFPFFSPVSFCTVLKSTAHGQKVPRNFSLDPILHHAASYYHYLPVPAFVYSAFSKGLKAIPGCRDLLDLQAALTSGWQPSWAEHCTSEHGTSQIG